MDTSIKVKFEQCWRKYFHDTDMPIVFYYTDDENDVKNISGPKSCRCVISDIYKIQNQYAVYFDPDSANCNADKRYFGFRSSIPENFNYFLSCGIEGKRYKKISWNSRTNNETSTGI